MPEVKVKQRPPAHRVMLDRLEEYISGNPSWNSPNYIAAGELCRVLLAMHVPEKDLAEMVGRLKPLERSITAGETNLLFAMVIDDLEDRLLLPS